MLGKELRSSASGIWLNYALPVDELTRGCDAIVTGTIAEVTKTPAPPLDLRRLGIVLVPDLLDRTPPFVDTVLPDSPAARAGLRPDDLVIAVGTRSVTSRDAMQRAVGGIAPGDPVRISVIRSGAVVECDVGPRPHDREAP
jgi:serine protease Do